jgi:hypothetical protein
MSARRRLALVALATFTAVAVASPDPADAAGRYRSERCAWLAPHLAAAGLPVGTFQRIAWSESGCARNGVRVSDFDDLSTSRWGLNFRTAALRRTWARWCGATHWTQPGADVSLDVACVRAAWIRLGLSPWR